MTVTSQSPSCPFTVPPCSSIPDVFSVLYISLHFLAFTGTKQRYSLFFTLAFFTLHSYFATHPGHVREKFSPFYWQVVFHCLNIPHLFIYSPVEGFGLFPVWGYEYLSTGIYMDRSFISLRGEMAGSYNKYVLNFSRNHSPKGW